LLELGETLLWGGFGLFALKGLLVGQALAVLFVVLFELFYLNFQLLFFLLDLLDPLIELYVLCFQVLCGIQQLVSFLHVHFEVGHELLFAEEALVEALAVLGDDAAEALEDLLQDHRERQAPILDLIHLLQVLAHLLRANLVQLELALQRFLLLLRVRSLHRLLQRVVRLHLRRLILLPRDQI